MGWRSFWLNWRKSRTIHPCQSQFSTSNRSMGPSSGVGTSQSSHSVPRPSSGKKWDITCHPKGINHCLLSSCWSARPATSRLAHGRPAWASSPLDGEFVITGWLTAGQGCIVLGMSAWSLPLCTCERACVGLLVMIDLWIYGNCNSRQCILYIKILRFRNFLPVKEHINRWTLAS